MGIIEGGKEGTASWILRGDQAGKYDLSADFTGTLMPFDEDITINFKTDESLVVNRTDNALSISFRNIKDSDIKHFWDVEFTVTNTSGETINNVKLDFDKLSDKFLSATDIVIEYPSGLTEYIKWNGGNCDESDTSEFLPALYSDGEIIDSRELKPGESITGHYTVIGNKNNEYIN